MKYEGPCEIVQKLSELDFRSQLDRRREKMGSTLRLT